ncbi:AbiJ-NTD4 domain-containing protein [Terasakiella pusilla]|uniref:AbiJ-NTD4 domain-containing protein n=1 Tax=Terasakiella pusilla TaxID=64973 RepID=UPI003AA7B363
MNDSFSTRHGFRTDAVITVREDAPDGFRYAVLSLAEDAQGIKFAVNIIRRGLGEAPSNDWSPDYQRQDAQSLIEHCDWWRVYDIAEMIYSTLDSKYGALRMHMQFENGINDFCHMHGIGWQMVDGRFQVRGEPTEDTLKSKIISELHEAGKRTTANELEQAINDLSRRPSPDITGAVQHVGAAIECLARDRFDDPKLTLGKIINTHPEFFQGEYKKLAHSIWAITSNKGRHIEEGGEPTFHEAMLLVGVTSSFCSYLLHKD